MSSRTRKKIVFLSVPFGKFQRQRALLCLRIVILTSALTPNSFFSFSLLFHCFVSVAKRLDGGGVPISSKQDKFQLSDYEVSPLESLADRSETTAM